MMKKLELLSCPKTKRSWYGLRKKKISRFLSFCPIPKIENLEISEIWFFFQILTVVSLETTKIWMEQETESFWYKLKEKKFWDFWVFKFGLYPRLKTWKSQKFCLPWILKLVVTQDLRNAKEMSWDKN